MTNSSRQAIQISQSSPGLKWQFSSVSTSHHQDSDYEVQKEKSDYVLNGLPEIGLLLTKMKVAEIMTSGYF